MSQQALDNVISALKGNNELLMKKKIIALGKHYNVMDNAQKTVCSVHLSALQNLGGAGFSQQFGKWVGRAFSYKYVLKDANDEVALEIRKGGGPWKSFFEVIEPDSGKKSGSIGLKRSFLIGGLKASWLDPSTGAAQISTRGNVVRRKYIMVDQSGKEIAKVRHKIVAVRDVWKLELFAGVNQLDAVLFATVLDFEKEM